MLTALGSMEAEMKIIGCDLHAAQQTIAMFNRETGEVVEQTLSHEAETVREFYAGLGGTGGRGLEATGSMGWFVQVIDELGGYVPRGTSGDNPQGGDAHGRNTIDAMRRCCSSC